MESKLHTVEIRSLDTKHASDIYNLIISTDKSYYQYFTAFKIDLAVIATFLSKAENDCYLGFFVQDELIGFFMLRGFDEGYQIPSYGVFISEKYSSVGLARLSVMHAIAFCKLNRINKLMLKVHPSNTAALNLYRDVGFVENHIDPSNKNMVFYKDIF